MNQTNTHNVGGLKAFRRIAPTNGAAFIVAIALHAPRVEAHHGTGQHC
jgi:hypothetical protein